MITAIILHLQSQADGRIHGATGRASHGFWYNQWKNIAPAIADNLHQNREIQPFALSPLMGLPYPQKGTVNVPKGSQAWLRVVTLEKNISQALLQTWLPHLPDQIRLANIPWEIRTTSLSPQEHPWANQQTYTAILDNAQPAHQWRFEFHTPTAFRLGKKSHLPFPLPGILLHSWMRRWNAFSPHPLPDTYRDLFREELFISAYKLKTVPVRYGQRLIIGGIGQFTLRAGSLTNTQRSHISALARYASYCGSGVYSTQGMGLTQLITAN